MNDKRLKNYYEKKPARIVPISKNIKSEENIFIENIKVSYPKHRSSIYSGSQEYTNIIKVRSQHSIDYSTDYSSGSASESVPGSQYSASS